MLHGTNFTGLSVSSPHWLQPPIDTDKLTPVGFEVVRVSSMALSVTVAFPVRRSSQPLIWSKLRTNIGRE
jgi:hypothetical protein